MARTLFLRLGEHQQQQEQGGCGVEREDELHLASSGYLQRCEHLRKSCCILQHHLYRYHHLLCIRGCTLTPPTGPSDISAFKILWFPGFLGHGALLSFPNHKHGGRLSGRRLILKSRRFAPSRRLPGVCTKLVAKLAFAPVTEESSLTNGSSASTGTEDAMGVTLGSCGQTGYCIGHVPICPGCLQPIRRRLKSGHFNEQQNVHPNWTEFSRLLCS